MDKNTHKAIVRITENRGFQRQFHGAQGLYKKAGLSYDHWPLFKKLMERIRDVATNGGAQVMIASDYGPGLSKWMRDWYRAPPGNKTKNLFSMNNRRLRSLANSIGIKFIEPSKNDERARNDPHLNETGHLDKANNLYEFLMGAFGNEIRSR